MVYIATINTQGDILNYRAEYYKRDEYGSVIIDSVVLSDREVILPVEFPELIDLDNATYKDGVVYDENGEEVITNKILGGFPTYRMVKDKSDFTKFEWLLKESQQVFDGTTYKLWSNPTLYYVDVVDELSKVLDTVVLGGILHIVPAFNGAPVLVEGKENIQNIYNKFSEMYELAKEIDTFKTVWMNEQPQELVPVIDELMQKLRRYL